MTEYLPVNNSNYLDAASYQTNGTLPVSGAPVTDAGFQIGIVVGRANDPTNLLGSDWASRQKAISEFNKRGDLWLNFGADPDTFNDLINDINKNGYKILNQPGNTLGYVDATAANRTIWIDIKINSSSNDFQNLFNTPLLQGIDQQGNTIKYWQGNLSLPADWINKFNVQGIIIPSAVSLVASPGNPIHPVSLSQGPQSIGNSSSQSIIFSPQVIANINNYPVQAQSLGDGTLLTGPIGLIEPGIGNAVPPGENFNELLNDYRELLGISSKANVTVVAPSNGSTWGDGSGNNYSGERSLDVGVVSATNPLSKLVIYAGADQSYSAIYAYQNAVWDLNNSPEVVSSSYSYNHEASGSPFLFATQQLFIDAALRNITMLNSSGDGGSSSKTGNGLTNVDTSVTSPYAIIVGGTSISTPVSAAIDPTLSRILQLAASGDKATLLKLMAGGMTSLPNVNAAGQWFMQTVWNTYDLEGNVIEYGGNHTSTGGVDTTQKTPLYQKESAIFPLTAGPTPQTGRATPDVSALSGGNMFYLVPTGSMAQTEPNGGTSASTPFWASLISQYNAIFKQQGLPALGYMNDLLYISATVAPSSFNDVVEGNNISAFVLGGALETSNKAGASFSITPTGFGYTADNGFDQTTGLGSPNGILLGRTLSTIAQTQYYGQKNPILIRAGSDKIKSAFSQTLLVQNENSSVQTNTLFYGDSSLKFISSVNPFAWNSTIAQQSLQTIVDDDLIELITGGTQGASQTIQAKFGDELSLMNSSGNYVPLYQASLTNDFGFIRFGDAQGTSVVLARPVAIAQNVEGQSNQYAIIRMRTGVPRTNDNSTQADDLTLELYRVDNLSGGIERADGTISNPGDMDYISLAEARNYAAITGKDSLEAPDPYQLSTSIIQHVDQNDIIAMKVTNKTTGEEFWSFSEQNPKSPLQGNRTHIWNYGLNTWGWDVTLDADNSDQSFTDLIVGIDFISLNGQQSYNPLLADLTPNTYSIYNTFSGNNPDRIYLLYQTSFNRLPDAKGFDAWTKSVDKGVLSLTDVANAFVQSPEFAQSYGQNVSNSEFITELYENAFGRQPDIPGKNYWLDQMESGASKADVMLAFTYSSEMINDYSNHMVGGYWIL